VDILEDLPRELAGGPVTQGAAEGAHAEADEQHVPEVEGRLHQPVHAGLEDEVVDGVEEDVERRGPPWSRRPSTATGSSRR